MLLATQCNCLIRAHPLKITLELQLRAQMHGCLECWSTPLLYTRSFHDACVATCAS
jgi:uncharacterized protein YqiB (DUF1249 family)